jgi:NADH:ubiquinone oxidoreductase subunit 4 (subunit M)
VEPELLLAAAATLGMAVVFAPPRVARGSLLTWGLAGLAGMAAIAVAPSLDLVLLILLVLAVLQARLASHRDFAARIRAPVLAIALLAIGLAFERVQGPAILDRFGAVGLVAGLVAAVGLLPYVHEFDPEESVVASPIPWIAFVGPLLAATLMSRAKQVLPADAGDAFGAMLLGLGLLNILWGSVAAWRTENGAVAWRYSFMADWGLVLCGFGLAIADGQGAALILLFSIVLGRLPLYLWSRQALREKTPTDRPINLLVAAALAGSAPFAGFAARVLLLRGATQVYWPLALVLAVAMLLWLPASLRLGRSMGLPRGRQAVGVAIVLAVNVVLGLYPQPLLALAGL